MPPFNPIQAENPQSQSRAADDPQKVEQGQVIMQTMDGLRRMRYFRRQYDPRRAYWYRQYLGQRDQRFYPDNLTPRSNTFVTYPFSNVEAIVARVLDAYF